MFRRKTSQQPAAASTGAASEPAPPTMTPLAAPATAKSKAPGGAALLAGEGVTQVAGVASIDETPSAGMLAAREEMLERQMAPSAVIIDVIKGPRGYGITFALKDGVAVVRRVDGKVSAVRGSGTELVSFDERAGYVAALESAWLEQFRPQIDALRKGFGSSFPQLSARLSLGDVPCCESGVMKTQVNRHDSARMSAVAAIGSIGSTVHVSIVDRGGSSNL